MNNIKQILIAVAAMATTAISASAQTAEGQFSLKAYGDFNLTRAYSLRSNGNCVAGRSQSSSDFGIDFGWTFYEVKMLRLSANAGIRFTPGKQSLSLKAGEWNYTAPAEADIDGEPYIRYVRTSAISQTYKTFHVGIPLYIDADLRVHSKISIYAQLGFAAMFNAKTTPGAVSGTATSQGLYPQYDNLIIDSPVMNGFGETKLTPDMATPVKAKTFVPEMLAGIGARFNLYEPLWLELGFTYRYGGNIYSCGKLPYPAGTISPQGSPVTYTAARGTQVKSPVNYLTADRHNALHLSLALIYKF